MTMPDLSHPLVAKAHALAVIAHAGQTRRGWDKEVPYIRHVEKVMLRTPKDPILQAVAALHDSVEDARIRFSDLDTEGLPQEVIRGVSALTRMRNVGTGGWAESYAAFIERIRTTDDGRWVPVKIADILSNLADIPTPKQIRKYSRALLTLVPADPSETGVLTVRGDGGFNSAEVFPGGSVHV